MPSGTAALQDTRGYKNYLGEVASAIKNRTISAAKMARKERAYAEEQAEKQDTSLDEAGIGKGYFFKRALGSTFGGDKIARTRGYFEKNPPAGRDPTGTRESRFRAQFDYKASVTPLEPVIPPPKPLSPFDLEQARKKVTLEKMLEKPSKTVATEDGEATQVIDKSLNKQVAALLGPIELQLTRLAGKLEGDQGNTNKLAGLVSKNSQILVKGFDSIVAAMSAFKDAITEQTETKKTIAKEQEQTAEKLADRQSVEAEQIVQEQIDGEAGNADVLGEDVENEGKKKESGGLPNFLSLRHFGKFGRGLKFLANPKVLTVLAALAAGAGLSAFLGKFVGGPRVRAEAEREKINREAGGDPAYRIPDAGGSGSMNNMNRQYTNPTAIPGDYDYRVPGALTGGETTRETLLRVSEGNTRERVTPMNSNTYEMQAKAQYEVMKKNRSDYAKFYSAGLGEYFDRRNGWNIFGSKLLAFFQKLDPTKLFSGNGDGNNNLDDPSISRDEEDYLLRLMIAEAGGEGEIGMAAVARSVLNRAGLIQSGEVRPGMFNAKSGSITDVIQGEDQYQPYAQGKLDRELTAEEKERAKKALAMARNIASLRGNLEAQGLDAESVNRIVASTGFRNYDAGAGDDASQRVNETVLGAHTFNTAGNAKMMTPTNVRMNRNVGLTGKNTFIQGNTGESDGDHFHIGPEIELWNKPEGKTEAIKGAKKIATNLMGRNIPFTFSNYWGTHRWWFNGRDKKSPSELDHALQEEQKAHAARPRGGSFGGIDIAAPQGTSIPGIKNVSDRGDGFGMAGTISGTRAFVGHGKTTSKSDDSVALAPPGTPPSGLEEASREVALSRDVRSRTPTTVTMPEVASANNSQGATENPDSVEHAMSSLTPWWMSTAGAGRA